MSNTIKKIAAKKGKEVITMVTAFDSLTASMAEAAGIDIILVGDSLGNTALGLPDTLGVSFEMMLHHATAVTRVVKEPLVVFDMPFMSYTGDDQATLDNCGAALAEAGAQAIKMEGGAFLVPLIEKLQNLGVPVMGHLGLMPQHLNSYGGMFIQGRDSDEAKQIIEDALLLEEAGVFSLVLEGIPEELAATITEKLSIPVIGIGAGKKCDGQVQVIADLLGMSNKAVPKHAQKYADFFEVGVSGIKKYIADVKNNEFPGEDNTFH